MKHFSSPWISSVLFLALLSGCAGPVGYQRYEPPAYTAPAPTSSSLVPYTPPVIDNPYAGALYHTVLPKETLWRIGQRYGVPVKALMDSNQIVDPTNIKIGTRLYIPGVREIQLHYEIPLIGSPNRWQYIVVHHTATLEGDADSINLLHLKRGWKNGLGYHFLIDNGTLGHRDGEVEIGRRWFKQMNGAHANKANMNEIGIGISLVGNFSQQNVSQAQLESLAHVVKTLQRYYRIPKSNVLPHRGVPGAATECPGTRFPWSRFLTMLD